MVSLQYKRTRKRMSYSERRGQFSRMHIRAAVRYAPRVCTLVLLICLVCDVYVSFVCDVCVFYVLYAGRHPGSCLSIFVCCDLSGGAHSQDGNDEFGEF